MRHAESQQEVTRQVRILRQQNRGRIAGKTLAVTNEMSLVVVAAGNSRVNPVARFLPEDAKDVVKTLHATEELRRETHTGLEAPLQLPDTYTKIPRECGEIRGALIEYNPANGLRHNEIAIRGSIFGRQERSFDSGYRFRRLKSAIEVSRKRRREIFHRREPAAQFVHRMGKHPRSSVRMKSNPQSLSWAIGPHQQGTFNLAGEETTGLAAPLPGLKSLKRLAPVENQFRMTIRDRALRRGVLAIVLQSPKAIDERPEPDRRPNFTIVNHLRHDSSVSGC
jgi:hypothetical protein